jgi:hypothetical protein
MCNDYDPCSLLRSPTHSKNLSILSRSPHINRKNFRALSPAASPPKKVSNLHCK